MVGSRVLFLCLVLGSSSSVAMAQHHHHGGGHHSGYRYSGQVGSGYDLYGGYAGYSTSVAPVSTGSVIVSHWGHPPQRYEVGAVPVFVSTGPVWFPPAMPQPVLQPIVSVEPIVQPTPAVADDPIKLPAKPSTPAGRLKSLEYQANGDEKLRKQRWALAYMSYRSAIDAAGDRGEARFRQGFTYTAMQHFSSAVREFKRGLFLAPEIAESGITLPSLFGPESEVVRTSIVNKVADWVREDPQDPDRLFLLGLMLHYESDPRSLKVLRAARGVAAGQDDHIVALLSKTLIQPPGFVGKPVFLPELPPLPVAPNDTAVADNKPESDGLPPLSDKATPPVIVPQE
ncbi:MAG: hypothetical protein JSS49_15215 [Planctomycetes bacterium]|nr:hypothetical protein [Planctomycetota bacterium]